VGNPGFQPRHCICIPQYPYQRGLERLTYYYGKYPLVFQLQKEVMFGTHADSLVLSII